MLRLTSNELGISQGEVMIVSDFDSQGPMWTAQGERSVRYHVAFDTPFLMPPVVQLSPCMWDLDAGSNQRGDLTASNVTANGFDIVFHT
ncbi:MAG: hypothetical protein FJX25_19640, partial [Alphaproteobacteria bacterium]|nr:hypothetical protein [Alphaproteobacteria bacterium]